MDELSRRERQILSMLHELGAATAAQVQERLADGSSYSAVRAVLRVLEHKGAARHRREGRAYVYRPAEAPSRARRRALDRVVRMFFDGSVARTMSTLIREKGSRLDPGELDELERLIDEARGRGR